MGVNFRKSKKILPGVKLNFSKKGVGATIGGTTGRVSFSSKGATAGFSIPGTGVSYSTKLTSGGKSTKSSAKSTNSNVSQSAAFDADKIAEQAAQAFDNDIVPPSFQKSCNYCDSPVPEDVIECPFCGSKDFSYRCSRCGSLNEVPHCVSCDNEMKAEREHYITSAVEEAQKAAKVQKAQDGLWWKVLLSLFIPYIGAYFLITPYMSKGYRKAGIAWCIIYTLMFVISTTVALSTKYFVVIGCMLPTAIYICRLSWNKTDQEMVNINKYWTWLAVTVSIFFIMCFFCGHADTNQQQVEQQEQNAAEVVEVENKYAEDDVVEEFVVAYNSISDSPFEELEKGNIRTKYYGHSHGYYIKLLNAANTRKINVTIDGKDKKTGVTKAKKVFVDTVRVIDPSISEEKAEERFNKVVKGYYDTKPFGKHMEITSFPSNDFNDGYIEIAAI